MKSGVAPLLLAWLMTAPPYKHVPINRAKKKYCANIDKELSPMTVVRAIAQTTCPFSTNVTQVAFETQKQYLYEQLHHSLMTILQLKKKYEKKNSTRAENSTMVNVDEAQEQQCKKRLAGSQYYLCCDEQWRVTFTSTDINVGISICSRERTSGDISTSLYLCCAHSNVGCCLLPVSLSLSHSPAFLAHISALSSAFSSVLPHYSSMFVYLTIFLLIYNSHQRQPHTQVLRSWYLLLG